MTNSPTTASANPHSSSSFAAANATASSTLRKGSKLNKPRRDTPRRISASANGDGDDDLGGFILSPSSDDQLTLRDPEQDRAFQQQELERQARRLHQSSSRSRSRSRSASPTRRPVSSGNRANNATTDATVSSTTRPKSASSNGSNHHDFADSDSDETNKRKSLRARKATSARKDEVPATSAAAGVNVAASGNNGKKNNKIKIPGQRGDNQQGGTASLDELRGRAKSKDAAAASVQSPVSPKSAKLSPTDNDFDLAGRNRSRSSSSTRSSDMGQSRREREAVDRATLLKTEQARADMERLALIRAEREAAAARRQAEREAKATKAAALLAGATAKAKGGAKGKVAPEPAAVVAGKTVEEGSGGRKEKRAAGKGRS